MIDGPLNGVLSRDPLIHHRIFHPLQLSETSLEARLGIRRGSERTGSVLLWSKDWILVT